MSLQIKNLTKVYKNGVKALNDLSLTIGTGMIGLLGPNGAGKSTLMRTIATLQKPDAGHISFNGIDPQKEPMALRKILGYLPQEFGVYPKVSAENLLDYFALLKGITSKKTRRAIIQKVLEIANLQEVRKKNVSSYSGGMKQRFGIAQMLLNDPRLIIVDEPTAGLDPAERQRFLNILRALGAQRTVIFSTHIVEDVKDLCTELVIMNKGRILNHTTPQRSIKVLEGKIWSKKVTQEELDGWKSDPNMLSFNYDPDHSIRIRICQADFPGEGFEPAGPNLEDVYFFYLNQPHDV